MNGDRDWLHWWREPLAGMVAVGVGVYDSWTYGRDRGLTASLDEALVIGGIILMAGSRKLFVGNGENHERRPAERADAEPEPRD